MASTSRPIDLTAQLNRLLDRLEFAAIGSFTAKEFELLSKFLQVKHDADRQSQYMDSQSFYEVLETFERMATKAGV